MSAALNAVGTTTQPGESEVVVAAPWWRKRGVRIAVRILGAVALVWLAVNVYFAFDPF